MPRQCAVCNSPERESIDKLFLMGYSIRKIEDCSDFTFSQLRTHRAHVDFGKDETPESVVHYEDLSFEESVRKQTDRLMTLLSSVDDLDSKLKIESSLIANMKLLKDISDDDVTIAKFEADKIASEKTQNILSIIIDATEPFPDARKAILERIKPIMHEHTQ